MGHSACTHLQCLLSTAKILLAYCLYGLYSNMVPVHTAKYLLPLWAIRPVKSLSACRENLYCYSFYEPYRFYKATVIVKYS